MADATRTAADLPSILSPGRLFIGGEWVDAATGQTFEVVNPAKAETLTGVAEGDAADVDRAVAAARLAFDSGAWPGLPPRKRARILWTWRGSWRSGRTRSRASRRSRTESPSSRAGSTST